MIAKGRFDEFVDSVNEHWGELTPLMACEEMGELMQVLSKQERASREGALVIEGFHDELVDEIGDVIIAIGALKKRYFINDNDIELRIIDKMSRKYIF